jgi:hemoglobin
VGIQKFPITDRQIERLVTEFYARVRQDPDIGPIFLRAIGTDRDVWRTHEAKIASFWRNAVGMDRSYSGNPMMKHLANSEIRPEQFRIWLDIFERTCRDILPKDTAERMSALANRIGSSLQYGLVQFRGEQGAPPSLKPIVS